MVTVPALWTKHRKLAYQCAAAIRLPGAEPQDVQQEALIALWMAARTYDHAKGPFPQYARIVIERRLKTALTTARRNKQEVLNTATRKPFMLESRPGGREPFEILWEREEIARIRRGAKKLTPLEAQALADVLNGIAQTKTTDNAAYRARKKLRAAA